MTESSPEIAQVIVDVPSIQTDRLFSYAVPRELTGIVTPGMRVHVPFGARVVQGFVMVCAQAEPSERELKEIVEVLDVAPVLSAEQLELADSMRHTVFSYKISILKAMLPNLLNSSYDKEIDGKRWSLLSENEKLAAMKRVRSGEAAVHYLAKTKENQKREKWLSVEPALAAFQFDARSKKRLIARDFLSALTEPIRVKDVPFSRSVLAFFAENQLIKIEEKVVSRTAAFFEAINADKPRQLNQEQENALAAIVSSDKPILLEGITGSGKTEVYLQAIAHYLALGKRAIVLVPEISLTPQMTQRFVARFGTQVAILHSGLSDGEKYDEWRKIKAGEAQVVVGARSAIFAPLENIGIIIIDEEHETSYKQDANPRYHARDVALLRCAFHHATLVLGSATPSLESRARAERQVYQLIRLTARANPRALLPTVNSVDMRRHLNDQSADFSEQLLEKINEKLEKNEQIILMLNKRGYSSFLMCRECGTVIKCPNCDVSLTLHKDNGRWQLNCHYCGHSEMPPRRCPNCGAEKLRTYGTGTEKVQEELQALLPNVRILRMDVDTTRTKNAHEKILTAFGRGEADILLGTQMIAKGLDFPNVTLVGVINADTGLNLPDFRASERTFQLLMQVAGRAGRADKAGEVLIQTFNPEHYALALASQQDYETFYKQEMKFRQLQAYPPYYFTVQILVSHKNEELAVKKSYEILSLLASRLTEKARILGPTPRSIARTHNFYHYQVLIKYRFEEGLEDALNAILELAQLRENRELRVAIDSEPQNFV
ncbi:MAG: primosomal protein N' [Streptococcaceae bacterium]|jgi:primosomal protein N' (replication factor Y)|nr:primosomal protein N' [Streptococcaceae bacterium]